MDQSWLEFTTKGFLINVIAIRHFIVKRHSTMVTEFKDNSV